MNESRQSTNTYRVIIAECLGTFALVFCGTAAIVSNDFSGGSITHVGISMVFGSIVVAMIYAFGEISGAHFNPAVSIAFWFSGRMKNGERLWVYILGQFVGALLASAVLAFLFPEHGQLGCTIPAVENTKAFLWELLLSYLLMTVILMVSTGSKELGLLAGLAIGGTVMLEALLAGPITGASMNPFRSLAPAVISNHWQALWIYLTAPVLGMLLASGTCNLFRGKDCCDPPSLKS